MGERKYALLIIDMQNDFVLPGAPTCVSGAYATISCISRLLDLSWKKSYRIFRQRRLDMIHLVVCGTHYPNCILTTILDAVACGYRVINIIDATSAQTPEIAEANILDIWNIGVECLMLDEFLSSFGDLMEPLSV